MASSLPAIFFTSSLAGMILLPSTSMLRQKPREMS
jgi:hypothetical protein